MGNEHEQKQINTPFRSSTALTGVELGLYQKPHFIILSIQQTTAIYNNKG